MIVVLIVSAILMLVAVSVVSQSAPAHRKDS